MSTLAIMKSGLRGVDLTLGLAGFALNGVTALGAGAGIGYAYGRYRKTWIGQNSPRLAAAVGKLGAALLAVFGAPHLLTGVVDSVGQAGLTAVGMERGLEAGRKAAGYQLVAKPAAAALPAGWEQVERIGELPPAPAGEGLSWTELNELADMR